MKLMVMGAGYVGMPLIKRLRDLGYSLVITTTKASRVNELSQDKDEVLLLEPFDSKAFRTAIAGCDGVIILVAPKGKEPYEDVYLKSAKRIIAALEERLKPFHIIYTSSTSVFEGLHKEWVYEEDELHPTSDRAKTLVMTENCLLNCGVTTCVLRLGGIHGPGRELVDRAKKFSGKVLPGSGEEFTNHSPLNSILDGIIFSLENSLEGIYHLVSDSHPTRKELYSGLCEKLGMPPPLFEGGKRLSSYKVSNAKLKSASS